jgi:SAM-dependent methyltransferase
MVFLRLAFDLVVTVCRLPLKGRRSAIGVDLVSRGELQFCRNVIHELARRRPADFFCVFHHENTVEAFASEFPELAGRAAHLPHRALWWRGFRRLDLFVTTEQFVPGPLSVYTLTLFHGQPSKGLTFQLPISDALIANDAFFLYGPLQRQALEEHLAFSGREMPAHLSLFEIGYTKSDDLLGGKFDRAALLAQRGLDPAKKTVLYAPAFNAGASLRECGFEILETLCAMKHLNVLAKLPIDCLRPESDLEATGGTNWFEAIGRLEAAHANFRLERDLEADPALACADVVVTCVSSIGFEFLALKRPVVFFDTPRFFTRTLPTFFPGRDLSGWAERTTVNGGREFGLVVSACRELPGAIDQVLSQPETYPQQADRLPGYLLYHPGNATPAAVAKIDELLRLGVRSNRPAAEALAILHQVSGFNGLRARPRRWWRSLRSQAKAVLNGLLRRCGYTLTRTGQAFIDAEATISAARKAGLSICDYRERLEPDQRKRGRRDAIIREMVSAELLTSARAVCEIGAGTGQYLEKVMALAKPVRYEVYETDPGWAKFLRTQYSGTGPALFVHPADGSSLRQTKSGSCDLVHAHAVFVYLPLLVTLGYLKECVRVCRPGGHIMFDCFTERSLGLAQAEAWLAGEDRFPVAIPTTVLEEFTRAERLELVRTFPMLYGAGTVDYFIWRKN